jgi:TolA-binding protein
MKKLLFLVIVLSFLIVRFNTALQDGSFLHYLDTHPNPLVIPPIECYLGGTYYLFHNLDQAATYYYRIAANYPNAPQADDAYWEYLQTLDDSTAANHPLAVDAYTKYTELFPKGDHIDAVHDRIEAYKSGAR